VAALRDEAEVMPPAGDLPESLGAAEFQSRYGGPDGAGTARLRAEIDARVDALPAWR
jgi:hypothetical protein